MMNTVMDQNLQNIKSLITLGGFLGEYSIGLHLALIVAGVLMFGILLTVIAHFRGQGAGLVAVCMQDVLIGLACGLLVFTALGMPFFWGRALWRAFTWKMAEA